MYHLIPSSTNLYWPSTSQYRHILTQYHQVPLIIYHLVRHSSVDWIISLFTTHLMSHAQYTWSSYCIYCLKNGILQCPILPNKSGQSVCWNNYLVLIVNHWPDVGKWSWTSCCVATRVVSKHCWDFIFDRIVGVIFQQWVHSCWWCKIVPNCRGCGCCGRGCGCCCCGCCGGSWWWTPVGVGESFEGAARG